MVAPSKRVLVVDDEAIVRDSYNRVLTAAGYDVKPVPGGREALDACRTERFDAMVADLKMPDMDGMEVTRRVRHEFPEMPVIIATGYPTSESAAEAEKLGVSDYLQKPVPPDRLSAATAAALTRHLRAVVTEAVQAVTAPAAEPPAALTVEPTTPPAPTPAAPLAEEAEPEPTSAVKTLGMLALAPIVGLAYVVFLPLVGFGMLFALLGKLAAKKLNPARA